MQLAEHAVERAGDGSGSMALCLASRFCSFSRSGQLVYGEEKIMLYGVNAVSQIAVGRLCCPHVDSEQVCVKMCFIIKVMDQEDGETHGQLTPHSCTLAV